MGSRQRENNENKNNPRLQKKQSGWINGNEKWVLVVGDKGTVKEQRWRKNDDKKITTKKAYNEAGKKESEVYNAQEEMKPGKWGLRNDNELNNIDEFEKLQCREKMKN